MLQLLKSPWLLPAILALAFAVRLAAGMAWQARLPEAQAFGFPDSESYWSLARKLGTFDEFSFDGQRVFRTPGYPAVLAPLFWFWDDPPIMAARAESALCGTLAVAGVAWLARLLFNHYAMLAAALMAALYPGAIALGFVVLSEAPFCPLMLGQLICWTQALRATNGTHRFTWSLVGGVLAGGATLMRPSWLLFTPFAVMVSLIFFRARRLHVPCGVVMLVGLITTMSPWWIRNAQLTGRFVPTTLQVGASLYDGLNPAATGASDMRFVGVFEAQLNPELSLLPRREGMDLELALNDEMQSAALAWARANPGRVVQLAGIKFLRLWNVWPNAQEFRDPWLRALVAITYVPLLGAALWGAARFARREWACVLCLLPAIYFTLLHMVFVSSLRYREPAMLALMVLAAGGLTSHKTACIGFVRPGKGSSG